MVTSLTQTCLNEYYAYVVSPSISVSPTIEQTTDGVFEEGDPVDLDCVVSGDPLPTVKWEKLGSPVSNQQVECKI